MRNDSVRDLGSRHTPASRQLGSACKDGTAVRLGAAEEGGGEGGGENEGEGESGEGDRLVRHSQWLHTYASVHEASEAAQVLSVNAAVACVLTFCSTQSWRCAVAAALPRRLKSAPDTRVKPTLGANE